MRLRQRQMMSATRFFSQKADVVSDIRSFRRRRFAQSAKLLGYDSRLDRKLISLEQSAVVRCLRIQPHRVDRVESDLRNRPTRHVPKRPARQAAPNRETNPHDSDHAADRPSPPLSRFSLLVPPQFSERIRRHLRTSGFWLSHIPSDQRAYAKTPSIRRACAN